MGLSSLFKSSNPVAAVPATTAGQPPSKRQIYQSRFNHGPNFGALFVSEKWISDRVFGEKADGTSELDAVKSFVKEKGEKEAQSQFENHWKTWISDDDWKWLKDHGVTGVRVPIGYWMVGDGAPFAKDTPFEKFSKVYSNAWKILVEDIIKKAGSYGIGILVDLHGLPGGANGQDHSGTTSGKAELWDSSKKQSLAISVLEFIAREVKPFDNVSGLQILNEAPWDSSEGSVSKDQKSFYSRAIEKIRAVNPDVPLVISDGWDLRSWIAWVEKYESKLGDGAASGLVIDTHVYKCFSDEDKQKNPEQLLGDVDNAVAETDNVDIQVGEFSCVLDGQSWDKHDGRRSRDEIVKEYADKQSWHFYHRARAGAYFWTYKFEHGRGGEWDFREMVDKGGLPNFTPGRQLSGDDLKKEFESRLSNELGGHSQYWKGVDGKKDWQDWRYQDGFTQGWNDAAAFDAFDHSEIGRLAAWTKSRFAEHIKQRGNSDVAWVYTHGFRKGVDSYVGAIRG